MHCLISVSPLKLKGTPRELLTKGDSIHIRAAKIELSILRCRRRLSEFHEPLLRVRRNFSCYSRDDWDYLFRWMRCAGDILESNEIDLL
jgi:hypothetical protein